MFTEKVKLMAKQNSDPEPEQELDAVEVDSPEPELSGGDEPGMAQSSLASILRSHNFEFEDDVADEDIVSRMSELEEAYEERERLKQENLQYRTQLAQRQQQPEQQEPAETPEAPANPSREIPPSSDLWEGMLTTDDRGNVVLREEWRGSADPSIPEKYLTRKKWERENLQKFFEDPRSFIGDNNDEDRIKNLRDELKKELLEEFRAEQQQESAKSFMESYAETHADWLYENGDYSRIGNLFNERVSAAINGGFSPKEAIEYAEAIVEKQTGQSPWQASEEDPDEPPARSKRVQLRRRQVNGKNRIPQGPVEKRKPGDSPRVVESYSELRDEYRNEMLQALGELE